MYSYGKRYFRKKSLVLVIGVYVAICTSVSLILMAIVGAVEQLLHLALI